MGGGEEHLGRGISCQVLRQHGVIPLVKRPLRESRRRDGLVVAQKLVNGAMKHGAGCSFGVKKYVLTQKVMTVTQHGE